MTAEKVMPRGYDEEERYFHEREIELLKRKRTELDTQRHDREQRERKTAHWMKCPKCGADLEEVELEHIKADKCTNCQGLYFDKGELELLIEAHSFLHRLQKLLRTEPPKAFS